MRVMISKLSRNAAERAPVDAAFAEV